MIDIGPLQLGVHRWHVSLVLVLAIPFTHRLKVLPSTFSLPSAPTALQGISHFLGDGSSYDSILLVLVASAFLLSLSWPRAYAGSGQNQY